MVGGVQLPFTEDFESASFDTKSWMIDNPDDKKTWDLLPVSVGESEFASYVNIKGYNGFGERDRLISPLLNFYYHKDISFSFKYAYAQRISGATDSLIVYLSQNGGQSWNRILSLGEDTDSLRMFATHDPTFENFIAEDTASWCGAYSNPQCVSVDLSEYYGLPNMRIMFESYNGFGNNLIIDDIIVEGMISSTEENKFNQEELTLFPNPSNGQVSISLNGFMNESQILVMDMTGKIVFQKLADTTNEIVTYNFSHFPKGVYIVEVRSNNYTQTQKLILK